MRPLMCRASTAFRSLIGAIVDIGSQGILFDARRSRRITSRPLPPANSSSDCGPPQGPLCPRRYSATTSHSPGAGAACSFLPLEVQSDARLVPARVPGSERHLHALARAEVDAPSAQEGAGWCSRCCRRSDDSMWITSPPPGLATEPRRPLPCRPLGRGCKCPLVGEGTSLPICVAARTAVTGHPCRARARPVRCGTRAHLQWALPFRLHRRGLRLGGRPRGVALAVAGPLQRFASIACLSTITSPKAFRRPTPGQRMATGGSVYRFCSRNSGFPRGEPARCTERFACFH